MVRPYSMRDCPTAKSAISIISWTSPSPSALILPFSIDTRLPSASLYLRSSSPMSRTASPRFRPRPVAPAGASANRRAHHMLVVRERRTAYLRQPLGRSRVDGFDDRARGLPAPAVAAGPGPRVDVAKPERLQGIGC